MIYAYARVSAKDQNLQRQIAAFCEFGIEKSRIFSEKKSGKDFERKEYKRLLKKLNCGDLLVIKSIDRLGRNYSQIIEEWNRKTTEYAARRRAALYPPEQKEKKDYAGRGYIKDDLAGNGRKDVRADRRTAGTSAEKSGASGIFGTSGRTAERPAGDPRRPGSGGSAPGGKTTGGNSSAPGRTRNIPVYTPEQQREENRERMQALRENVEDIAYASASFGIGALGAVTSFVSKACDRKYDRMRDRKRQKNQRGQEVRHDRKVQKHDQ